MKGGTFLVFTVINSFQYAFGKCLSKEISLMSRRGFVVLIALTAVTSHVNGQVNWPYHNLLLHNHSSEVYQKLTKNGVSSFLYRFSNWNDLFSLCAPYFYGDQ